MARPDVYILKTPLDGEDALSDAAFAVPAREMLRALGVDPGNRAVMIKPNVTAGAPRNSGIVTHPAFVAGLVDYFVEDAGVPVDGVLRQRARRPGKHGSASQHRDLPLGGRGERVLRQRTQAEDPQPGRGHPVRQEPAGRHDSGHGTAPLLGRVARHVRARRPAQAGPGMDARRGP